MTSTVFGEYLMVIFAVRASIERNSFMTVPYTIILPTEYGQMLVSRFDKNQTRALLKTGYGCDREQINFLIGLCQKAGDGAVVMDIGANFGTYTIACAPFLAAKGGLVHAFEPQRVIFHMLCGSVALNGLENVHVHNVCVGNSTEHVALPRFDYGKEMNFGSIEFGGQQREVLDQTPQSPSEQVPQVRIDDMALDNVLFMKIDVEGMEELVLAGAIETIRRSRPVALVEFIKSDVSKLVDFFIRESYVVRRWNENLLCMPSEIDKVYFGSSS